MEASRARPETDGAQDAGTLREREQRRIDELELETVMGNGKSFSPVYFLLMIGFAYLMQPAVGIDALALWVMSYTVYILGRTLATVQYHKDPIKHSPERLRFWRGFVGKSAFVHGVIFGSTGVLALPALDPISRIVLTSFFVVVCAGCSAYAAAMYRPLAVLLIVSMLPYIVMWWPLGEEMKQPIAGILLITVGVSMHLAWRHHLNLLQGFRETLAKEQLAEELTESNRQLDAIGAARSHLFAIASHDLRGPVHAIGLAVGQLDERAEPGVLGRQFEKLREHTALVAEMLGDMMDLSRLERHERRVNLASVSLDQMFEQVRLNFEGIAREKGLQIHFHSDGAWVLSDGHLLRRVLFNLVSNAIRYTPRGEVVVRSERHGDVVDILISDTGVGIASSTHGSIFEDYVQLSDDGASAEGMGLGLPFARRASEQLGHELTLTSELGKGSTFTVRARAAPPLVDPEPAAGMVTGAGAHAAPRGAPLLVVENDPFTLDAICGLLEKWGYPTIGALGGEDMMGKVADFSVPALVISDLQLSNSESGLDVIAALRAHYGQPRLPALLLTGNLDRAVEVQTAERGIVLIHKPIAPAKLRREIEALLAP
jgi:signal transduction histidine kinase/CheY-like chemotaxis protein